MEDKNEPVVFYDARDKSKSLRVRLPEYYNQPEILREVVPGVNAYVRPYGYRTWSLSPTHVNAVLYGLARRFGGVTFYHHHKAVSRCDRRCTYANYEHADLCECSCRGVNHGSQSEGGYKRVPPPCDTMLIRSETDLTVRRITPKDFGLVSDAIRKRRSTIRMKSWGERG